MTSLKLSTALLALLSLGTAAHALDGRDLKTGDTATVTAFVPACYDEIHVLEKYNIIKEPRDFNYNLINDKGIYEGKVTRNLYSYERVIRFLNLAYDTLDKTPADAGAKIYIERAVKSGDCIGLKNGTKVYINNSYHSKDGSICVRPLDNSRAAKKLGTGCLYTNYGWLQP